MPTEEEGFCGEMTGFNMASVCWNLEGLHRGRYGWVQK